MNLLPPELSVIQFVDYRAQDKQAAFAIVRAIKEAAVSVPLPDPLPPEPPIPISYLGDLRSHIETSQDLSLSAQRDLLFEVKMRLKDPESGADALELLRLLRDRQDLLASIAEEVDAILDRKPQRRPQRKPPAKKKEETAPEPETAEPPPVTASPPVAVGPPPQTIELTDDVRPLEDLVARVAANAAESWILKVGADSMRIHAQEQNLLLEVTFARWGDKDAKCLRALGWTPAPRGMQAAAGVALGALALATSGLGMGLLAHKGTRDYLNKNQAQRQFPLAKAGEAAASILACFRVLSPDIKKAVAEQLQAAAAQ